MAECLRPRMASRDTSSGEMHKPRGPLSPEESLAQALRLHQPLCSWQRQAEASLPCKPRARGVRGPLGQPFPSISPGPGTPRPLVKPLEPAERTAPTSAPHRTCWISQFCFGSQYDSETELPPREKSKPVAIRPIHRVLRFFSLEQSRFLSLYTFIFLFN